MLNVVRKVGGAINDLTLRGVVSLQTAVLTMASELMASESAEAQTLGGSVQGITTDLGYVPALLSIAAYVIGAGFVIHGLVNWRKHSHNPNAQVNMMGVVVEMLVGVALISITAWVTLIQGTTKLNQSSTITKPNF